MEKKTSKDECRENGDLRSKPEDKKLPIDIDQAELEQVTSNVPECLALKLEYDECFNNWFSSSFIRGHKTDSPCEDLLQAYTSCVKKGLQEQNFELFHPSCLNATDPNIGRTEEPRKDAFSNKKSS